MVVSHDKVLQLKLLSCVDQLLRQFNYLFNVHGSDDHRLILTLMILT
jgi:hypothetical protein